MSGPRAEKINELKGELEKEQNKNQPDEEKIKRLVQKIMIAGIGTTGDELNGMK